MTGVQTCALPILAGHETAIFAFLVVAACIICIPIVFSILAMRKPALPTLVLLVLAAFATYIELPLLTKLGVGRGPDWLHLTLINAFSLLPVLFVSIALRLAGYQLSAATERQEYKSEAEVFVS